MNGYEFSIAGYKQVLESGRTDIDREYIQAEIKALEPFACRTEQEIIKMFDSGAFNEVLKAYCKKAMENSGIDKEKIDDVMGEIKWLLDTVRAEEIIK